MFIHFFLILYHLGTVALSVYHNCSLGGRGKFQGAVVCDGTIGGQDSVIKFGLVYIRQRGLIVTWPGSGLFSCCHLVQC